jgi:SagB-type dehydrogenase family enzyme
VRAPKKATKETRKTTPKKRSKKKKATQVASEQVFVRLSTHVALDVQPSGEIAASFNGMALGLGKVGGATAKGAQELRTGLPLNALADRDSSKELAALVRRLARLGLLEYRLGGSSAGTDQIIIEPQTPDYWPQTPALRDADVLVLSRFAYMRRRASELVLESPRAGALFTIRDPKVAVALAVLTTPQQIGRLRRQAGFPGLKVLALLVDCRILFKVSARGDQGLRPTEGDEHLVLWDFHDLVFHARSTEGRHANPLGGTYPYVGVNEPPPAVRPQWPGEKIDLGKFLPPDSEAPSLAVKLLRARHSVRAFDDQRPITLAELSQLLDTSARVKSEWSSRLGLGGGDDDGPMLSYTARAYPSGGSSYELELYLSVDKCDGLARGLYHYDPSAHVLASIPVRANELDAQLKAAQMAMGADAVPQILITMAARFGRISWKYSSIAYALILKDVGVLMQTLYLVATDIGLGGCAIGSTNIDLFARMTGLEFHVEGAVGQFALGRSAETESIS